MNEDLAGICKRCTNLEQLWLEACRGLDENIFEYLQFVEGLEVLGLRLFKQSFVKLKKLSNNNKLRVLDL